MLHTPVYDVPTRAYCGPTAISAVANEPISKIRKMIRRVRKENGRRTKDRNGRRIPVRGVGDMELLAVMKRLGFASKAHTESGMTLRAFCEDRGHMGPFIVTVSGHYVAISHGMICDTYTKAPVPCEQYPKLGCRVKRFWKFY